MKKDDMNSMFNKFFGVTLILAVLQLVIYAGLVGLALWLFFKYAV